MAGPVLRQGEGFSNQSPEKRDDIRRMQELLQRAGYAVDADGLFGQGTAKVVQAFQRDHGLSVDGIVGPNTWDALEAAASGDGASPASSGAATGGTTVAPGGLDTSVLEGFHGDASWVHAREGHAGKPYWPGGASGVTFDPGVDLGHAQATLVEQLYASLLTAGQLAAAQKVYGIQGADAEVALDADTTLQSIRISRSQADTIFPFAAKPYWDAVVQRFAGIDAADTLGSVQTAMLSLAYNRGAGNRALEDLKQPIADKDWSRVAEIIGSMQQDHQLEGIRSRRRMEAELIRNELAAV
ncbi:MAG: peptidoglycan-binding protein [Candidatus Tectomicrobia bacterium]|nr:peptidoglycan-binding protein [Candidatus Tectomicrobia bacterium]